MSPKSRFRWRRLRRRSNQPRERVQALLDELVAEYDKPEHGVTMREVAGGYKMTTKPEHHEAVRGFVTQPEAAAEAIAAGAGNAGGDCL